MHLYGDVEPLKLEYSSKKVIIPPKGKKMCLKKRTSILLTASNRSNITPIYLFFAFSEMYWRILGGGHMLSVESCTLNQTQLMWALGKKKFY